MNGLPFKEFYASVAKSQRILVVGDGRPDGDSLGASTAMYMWLKREGKTTRLFCVAPTPAGFSFLDGLAEQTNDPAVFDEPWDVVVTLDTGGLKHCGIDEHLKRIPVKPIIVDIDHHATNELFGDINLVDITACSTCEMVYRFFEFNNVSLDHKIATSLLTGLCTDTSHFSNSATNVKGMEAASVCFANGARHMDILRGVVRNKTVDGLKLWGTALERLHHVPELDMAVTYFTLEDVDGSPEGEEAIAGVSNFLNASLANIDIVLVLREKADGNVKASMRSYKRDISLICQKLGGGGHKKAAGFTVPGRITLKEGHPNIVEKVLECAV
jgi:phosphoesterase RecJ-like protein